MRSTDEDLDWRDILGLSSPDSIARLLDRLGYDTSCRVVQTPGNLGISRESPARRIKACELLADTVT